MSPIDARSVVVPVGGRTHWEVGGRPPSLGDGVVEVRAPAGVIAYEPADLTVTVGAGTSVLDLDSLLAEHGQMCPLDPRDSNATVGGLIAVGLSGVRRLRHGPLRDTVLEVRFVTADGRVVKGGGPTVKNVTGYDLPRLLVGSFGTLGVLVQMTLRCRPRPVAWQWASTTRPVDAVAASLFRPSSVLWDGENTFVLLEGFDRDIGVEARAAQLGPPCEAPALPNGTHRGRISVAPAALGSLRDALNDITGARWLAEWGVGTVHVAGDDPRVLVDARAAAARHGGWLLREAGGDEAFDGFGVALPNGELHRRIKEAFDPNGTCNPGRLPGPHPF